MKKSTFFSLLVIFILIPGTLLLGRRLPGRWYYLTSTAIVVEIMLPFFAAFEIPPPPGKGIGDPGGHGGAGGGVPGGLRVPALF